jgi:hypothetical protein
VRRSARVEVDGEAGVHAALPGVELDEGGDLEVRANAADRVTVALRGRRGVAHGARCAQRRGRANALG